MATQIVTQKGVGIAYLRCSDEKQEDSVDDQLVWALARCSQLGVSLNCTPAMLRDAK